jgi:GTPase SAR1 family protein
LKNDNIGSQEFLTSYIHTIGIDFLEKAVQLGDERIKLQIWDTAGQDRWPSKK